ncbi:unnamed protein product, partial [Tilletia controversa]
SGGAQYNSDDNAQYFDRYANDEIEDQDGIGGDDLSEERDEDEDEDEDDDDFNDADDYDCGPRPDARKRTASQAYSTSQQLPNKRSTTWSHAAQQPDKAKRTPIPRVLYKAAKSFRLNSESVKKLEDEIVTRIELYIKANPASVSDHFKMLFDDGEVRRAEIAPAVKQILSRLRGACGDRIHESMGIDQGTTKMSLLALWQKLCNGYEVPFTKQRALRICLMRVVA